MSDRILTVLFCPCWQTRKTWLIPWNFVAIIFISLKTCSYSFSAAILLCGLPAPAGIFADSRPTTEKFDPKNMGWPWDFFLATILKLAMHLRTSVTPSFNTKGSKNNPQYMRFYTSLFCRSMHDGAGMFHPNSAIAYIPLLTKRTIPLGHPIGHMIVFVLSACMANHAVAETFD
jgi:hypothetical protein